MRSSSNNRGAESGFTLIEILISVAIVGFIAYSIYLLSSRSYQLRDSLLRDSEFYSSIRLAMSVLERDVSLVYSPTLVTPDKKASPPSGQPDEPASSDQIETFWGPMIHSNGMRVSRFKGDDTHLSFVSLSHYRVYKDLPETEFAKISYELLPDSAEDAVSGTSILVRKENPEVFAEDELSSPKEKKYTILRGIKRLRFRYYDREKPKDGNNSWDSASSNFLNIYPDYVEATLEIQGPENMSFEGSFKMRLELPYRGIRQTI